MPTKLSRYCQGLIEATWIAAVVIIPLFFNIHTSRVFEPDKVSILRSLALVTLGAWIVKAYEDRGLLRKAFNNSRSWITTIWNTPMLAPAIGLAIVYLVSTLFSISPAVSWWGSYQRLQGTYTTLSYLIIFASILGNMRRWCQVERLINTIILASLPVALYAVIQYLQIDPIPWAGDTSTRVTANMGNSIFLSAYLILVLPLTIGKIIWHIHKIIIEDASRVTNIALVLVTGFIAMFQVTAIYLSQSRGPLLGLLVGCLIFALLVCVYWQKRWIFNAIILITLVGCIFLAVIAQDNGTLVNLDRLPGIGRFSMLLDLDSATAMSRKYIWQGAENLITNHPPLQFPDGSTDKFNSLRPIIGYGPETMYVAYNQYFPVELGQIEKRNATPDRSHNETWDTLVITGVLGCMEYLIIFGAVYYYAMKGLGLVKNKREAARLLVLLLAGSISGVVGVSWYLGIEYTGVGLPFGMIIGLVMYLLTINLGSGREKPHNENNYLGVLIVMMLVSAISAHLIEINFGIAIVVTRLLFWIYVGILVVIGNQLQSNNLFVLERNAHDSRETRITKKRGGRQVQSFHQLIHRIGYQDDERLPEWIRETCISGSIINLVLITFGYDFLANSAQTRSIWIILMNSLTRVSSQGTEFVPGMIGLIGLTLISGAILLTAGNERLQGFGSWWKTFLIVIGITGITAMVYWIFHSLILASLARVVQQDPYDVLGQVFIIGKLLSVFYLYIGIVLFISAIFLVEKPPERGLLTISTGGVVVALIIFVSLIMLVTKTNIQVIKADAAFKAADSYANRGQWQIATELYKQASSYDPLEDHYYLFLGRSYLEQAKNAQTMMEQEGFVKQAETYLTKAQSINPLNTDHTANLARLYQWWADRANNALATNQRGQIASQYYATAVSLSPNNVSIWAEWAILHLHVLDQPDQAYDILTKAIKRDPRYSFTRGLMGDYYLAIAESEENLSNKIEALDRAAHYYRGAVLNYSHRDTTHLSAYFLSLGNAYIQLSRLAPEHLENVYKRLTIAALEDALESDLSESDRWYVMEGLANLYFEIGDKENALANAVEAVSIAPRAYSERIQRLIQVIHLMP